MTDSMTIGDNLDVKQSECNSNKTSMVLIKDYDWYIYKRQTLPPTVRVTDVIASMALKSGIQGVVGGNCIINVFLYQHGPTTLRRQKACTSQFYVRTGSSLRTACSSSLKINLALNYVCKGPKFILWTDAVGCAWVKCVALFAGSWGKFHNQRIFL